MRGGDGVHAVALGLAGLLADFGGELFD